MLMCDSRAAGESLRRKQGHWPALPGREWRSREHKARPSRASPQEVALLRALEKIGKKFLYMTRLVFLIFPVLQNKAPLVVEIMCGLVVI